ncbi:MAG: ATP synthase F0 subunit B [Bacteriovorax sp.]|nr:ATP synthase F0 subunit B [Bacteriovorax sp.]
MKKILYYSFLITSFLSVAVANEEAVHHEASIWDLKYPFINFIILLAILSKVVKPLREKFNKQSDDVKSLMDSATRNSIDAEAKLATFQNKIKNLDSEMVKIVSEYQSDAVQFAKLQSEETQTTISRMKRDLENKLDGEKTELITELNHDLINKVVSSTQTKIATNKEYQAKATQKIVSELR